MNDLLDVSVYLAPSGEWAFQVVDASGAPVAGGGGFATKAEASQAAFDVAGQPLD